MLCSDGVSTKTTATINQTWRISPDSALPVALAGKVDWPVKHSRRRRGPAAKGLARTAAADVANPEKRVHKTGE